jgi:transcriptional regulator with XRE-family HTH domain
MPKEMVSRNLIHIARLRSGMSQIELARAAKTSQPAISAYESGKRSPSVETLTRLLAAAGFELRMQLATPDSHDASRKSAEKLLPKPQVQEHINRERKRSTSNGRGKKT